MLNWKNVGRAERKMMESLNLILSGHEKLLEFLFEADCPRLRQDAKTLIHHADGFSSGEQILIRLALDIWCGVGDVRLWEMIEQLDDESFRQAIKGLGHLRKETSEGPEITWRQPKTAY
jgi:hypothetical protein